MQKGFCEDITSPAASKRVSGRVRKSGGGGGGKEGTEEAVCAAINFFGAVKDYETRPWAPSI